MHCCRQMSMRCWTFGSQMITDDIQYNVLTTKTSTPHQHLSTTAHSRYCLFNWRKYCPYFQTIWFSFENKLSSSSNTVTDNGLCSGGQTAAKPSLPTELQIYQHYMHLMKTMKESGEWRQMILRFGYFWIIKGAPETLHTCFNHNFWSFRGNWYIFWGSEHIIWSTYEWATAKRRRKG